MSPLLVPVFGPSVQFSEFSCSWLVFRLRFGPDFSSFAALCDHAVLLIIQNLGPPMSRRAPGIRSPTWRTAKCRFKARLRTMVNPVNLTIC